MLFIQLEQCGEVIYTFTAEDAELSETTKIICLSRILQLQLLTARNLLIIMKSIM